MLLLAGADPFLPNHEGVTPQEVALIHSHPGCHYQFQVLTERTVSIIVDDPFIRASFLLFVDCLAVRRSRHVAIQGPSCA